MKACLDNIGIVLKAAGMDYSDVVSAQVFLQRDITQFKRSMNAVFRTVFKNAATGARYGRRRGARRAHCSCRDRGHRAAAGLEKN